MVAQVNPLLWARFATSHPKDLSDELLKIIASYPNICKSIHLPAQYLEVTDIKAYEPQL